MKKTLYTLGGLVALTLTSCKSCDCKFQGDLNNKRWELRQQRQRPMKFRPHIEGRKVKADLHKKMRDMDKKQHKKG